MIQKVMYKLALLAGVSVADICPEYSLVYLQDMLGYKRLCVERRTILQEVCAGPQKRRVSGVYCFEV